MEPLILVVNLICFPSLDIFGKMSNINVGAAQLSNREILVTINIPGLRSPSSWQKLLSCGRPILGDEIVFRAEEHGYHFEYNGGQNMRYEKTVINLPNALLPQRCYYSIQNDAVDLHLVLHERRMWPAAWLDTLNQ